MNKHLFEKFLEMEARYNLFELKGKEISPVWDVLRVSLFYDIFDKLTDRDETKKVSKWNKVASKLTNFFTQFVKGFILPRRVEYVFFYSPIFIGKDGKFFDRMAENMIDYTHESRCIYIGAAELPYNTRHKDYSLFFFRVIGSLLSSFSSISNDNYNVISVAIENTFGQFYEYEQINFVYKRCVRDYYACKKFLKWVRPKAVFVSMDLQKGLYIAAKECGIQSCEIQHGTMDYLYPSYSYPQFVDNYSNVAFADTFAMPGDGWGIDNNIPCKRRIVLGNSNFVVRKQDVCDDGSILVISNWIHNKYLVPLSIDLSKICSNRIIYKLHPSEYDCIGSYYNCFAGISSIKIASIDSNLSELLAKCSLVITVSSTVYYEAKTIGKRVAILKVDDYFIMEPYLKSSNNTCLIENAEDVIEALKMPEYSENTQYYKPFNINVASELLRNNSN